MGQITGKDNNRVPTVKECNEAYGFDAGSISGGITLGPHDSNRFMINVHYSAPVDLETILKDTDPVDCVYAFIIVADEAYHTIWLYRRPDGRFEPNGVCEKFNYGYVLHRHTQWHSDGTTSYESICLRLDGYLIDSYGAE